MAISQPEAQPRWKVNEPGQVVSELLELQTLDSRLFDRAIRAYERYGIPAPLVVWAAKRAWSQGTPHLFAAILMNHIEDCHRRLPAIALQSMIL